MSDSLNGQWQRPSIRDLGTWFAAAGSRPATDGKRWLSWPWIASHREPKDLSDFTYSGPLCIPRQWDFQDDGTITQRVPDEVVHALYSMPNEYPKSLERAKPVVGKWKLTDGNTANSLDPSGGILKLADTPDNFYFEADVMLNSTDMEAHFLMSYKDDLERSIFQNRWACYYISLNPRENLIKLEDADAIARSLEILPIKLEPNRPIKLRVFRSGPILEVFVDNKAVLTHRLYRYNEGGLALEFIDGTGEFANIIIRRLAPI